MTKVNKQLIDATFIETITVSGGLTINDSDPSNVIITADNPPTPYNDYNLWFTTSQLAMLSADLNNSAQLLGPSGNRFADSFDTLTYVDTAGAINLDTSTSGLLKPVLIYPLGSPISQATGTNFGDMTNGSGLAGIFDGNVSTFGWAPASNGYAGKTYSSARRIFQTVITSHGGGWDVSASSGSYTITMYGKNGSAPTTRTDGTILATVSGVDSGTTGVLTETLINSQPGNTFTHYWIGIIYTAGTVTSVGIAEMVMYDALPPVVQNLTVRSTSMAAATNPTKMRALLNARFVDSSVANTDYILDCSRDGGTTWQSMSLTVKYIFGNISVVESAETTVSAQPSGAVPRWRLRTLNNKNIEFHDIYFQWE